jgi:glycosyltransferase involved in cell wall biosynthesis
MLKVLELNFEKGWRGGERQVVYCMQGFRNVGISSHLVCRKSSPLEFAALKAGFTVNSYNSIFGVVFFLITKGKNFNCIHAQTSHILTYCVFTKFFHRAKVIYTRRVNFKQKGFFTKLKYSFTDKIIAISEAIQETLISFSGRNDIEVITDIVVKNEPVEKLISKILSNLPINKRRIIGTTSALTGEKDPFTMIEAIKKLSETRDDFVFLHFGSGDLQESIRKKIVEYKLDKIYFLMGFEENMEAVFPVFEVFVISSIQEGLGSSVLDAFMNHIPVVSTNAGGLKNLLAEERGILVEVTDSSSIAAGINRLLNNDPRREIYIQNGFNYANHYHSMVYITDKYINLLKGILKNSY